MNSPNLTIDQQRDAIRRRFTVQIKKANNKDYLKVAGRVALFRLDYPVSDGRGSLLTECIFCDDQGAFFKASVMIDGVIVVTGHARLSSAAAANAGGRLAEMCESNALGRALNCAGYGTDDLEGDDDQNIADSPVERRQPPRKEYKSSSQTKPSAAIPSREELIAREWQRTCLAEGVEKSYLTKALMVSRLGKFDWSAPHAIDTADQMLRDYLNQLSTFAAPKPSAPARTPTTGMFGNTPPAEKRYDPNLDAARN